MLGSELILWIEWRLEGMLRVFRELNRIKRLANKER